MKVVINALQYKTNSSGIGIMIRELLEPFTSKTAHLCQVILSKDSPEFRSGERNENIRIPYRYNQGIRRNFFQMFRFGPSYCRDSVLITTDSKVPFFLPRSCCVLPIVTDLAVFRLKETYQKSRVLLWRLQYRYLVRKAKHFIAVSEYTKRDIMDILHIPESCIDVLHCSSVSGIAEVKDPALRDEVRNKYELPEKYILFVGNTNPRKNLNRIIKAFDKLKSEFAIPHHLVIAGEQGWIFNQKSATQELNYKDQVHFLGFVDDCDMSALYSAADLFVFTTLYEGFGVPIVEAQRCGVPVVTSNCSSMPEVVGDAGIVVNPYNVDEIKSAMARILFDPELRRSLVNKGYQNVKRFSWEKSAERLSDIIEEKILGNRR